MKKKYLLIFIYIIFGKNFDGYILDIESGNPIENVELILSSNNVLITTSKTDGYFIIDIDNFEQDSILANHIGYINRTISISDLNNKVYLKKDVLYGDVIEVTSSRKEKRISDSPVLTQIISGEDLNNSPALNFYESLHMLFPSINFSPDTHGTNINIQGLSSEYILILVDGNRISGNTAGNIDFSQFNTEKIDRIEILKGSASTLYGSNAIGGVINIITKPIKDNETSISSNMSYGSFNKKNNYISINTYYNKISSKTDFKFKQSDGYQILKDNSTREQRKFNDYSINQRIKYKKEDLEIELNGDYYNHNWYRFLSQSPFSDNSDPEYDNRRKYESYSIGIKEKNHFNRINGHYNFSYNIDYYKKYYVIDNDYSKHSDDINYEWTNSKTEQISSLLYLFKNKYNITFGLDWINEKGQSNDIEHEGVIIKEGEFGNIVSKIFRTTAFFIQSQYELTQKINLFFGTRYTNHSKFNDRLTSEVTIKYNIDLHTFRLNISQGYKMPDIYELYYDWTHPGVGTNFMVIGNPDLKPEDSFNINLSYQKLYKNWNFTALLSRNYISNMINEYLEDKNNNGIEDYHYQNYEQVSINSAELTINGKFKNINLSTSYNFIRKIDELEDERLPNLSDHTITINSDIKVRDQLILFINFNYYSPKKNESITENSTIEISDYHQTNISIIKNGLIDYGLFKKINLKLGINNIFNYTNFKDVTFQSPGRTFVIEGVFNYDFK